ncbi:DUF2591 domain-containing protein [Pseudomonas protegens]|uniref:DUF2591 domain-containing protein n=1 Tax=Pseudomonas protegens TaxID=380021 RepID=A0A2T6GBB6_9PSED|nr:phage protein NinX family protein [Pseudomonas protegens]PUA41456.1 DUF2591 domain-containing protein [Pseudomonas protegens]
MTQMIEVKTADLVGPALDWAVAKSIGAYRGEYAVCEGGEPWPAWIFPGAIPCKATTGKFKPSTDWAHGGPLIAKHQVNLHAPQASDDCWAAWVTIRGKDFCHGGWQPLVAACRAIVAAKLGEVVSVPAELIYRGSRP